MPKQLKIKFQCKFSITAESFVAFQKKDPNITPDQLNELLVLGLVHANPDGNGNTGITVSPFGAMVYAATHDKYMDGHYNLKSFDKLPMTDVTIEPTAKAFVNPIIERNTDNE